MEKTPPRWRLIQRQNFTCLDALASFLDLSCEQKEQLLARTQFPLNLPLRLAQKIAKGTLDDPLLRQFVPLALELEESPSFVKDPVCDLSFRRSDRLLQKYRGRALLLASGGCAMHCRYCFRKDYPYGDSIGDFSKEMHILARDSSIFELILSGGDPLSLSNSALGALLKEAAAIPHLRRIRFHTRFPIGIPERIDEPLLELFQNLSKQVIFIVHVNHPRELDADVKASLKKIHRLNIPLLCHSVLLKGVNDDEQTLLDLSEELLSCHTLPYYLNLLDPVSGSSHFEVSEERGLQLISHLRKYLPGYGVPKLVREIPGKPHKTPIEAAYPTASGCLSQDENR